MTAVPRQNSMDTAVAPEPPSDSIDPRWLLDVFKRRWVSVVVVASVIFFAVAAYTLHQKPVYTATASVMIDAQRLQLFTADHNQAITSGAAPESNAVDTQVEVIRSRGVAERVVKTLQLDRDPEFTPSLKKSLGARANQLARDGLHGGGGKMPADIARIRHERIVDDLLGPLDVRRVGTTYVIAIDYTFPNPAKAAAIANAFAEEFLRDDAEAKLSVDRDATDLLNSRLVDLGDRAAQDTAAVQQYKIEHNLLATSGNTGSTLVEQEISNYNVQLASTKSQAAEDDARLRTARTQIANGSLGDDLGETLSSPVIQSLRAQRAIVSGQVAVLSAKYGPRYPDMLKAQHQLADLDSQIRAEIKRIVSSLQASADVSRERVASTERTLATARDTLASNGRAQVGLLALEGKAAASQSLYDAYLTRFKETSTQVGTERPDARIVSRAEAPTVQTAPKVGLYLAFGAMLAVGAGVVSMFVAEGLATGLASGDDVERKLGAPYLGSLPTVAPAVPSTAGDAVRALLVDSMAGSGESFRGLRANILRGVTSARGRVLGVTSPHTGDGKTTAAILLGGAAALQGWKAIVLDCDLTGRGLTAQLSNAGPGSLVEVLKGAAPLETAVVRDPSSGAAFLAVDAGSASTDDMFGGSSFAALLSKMREQYDIVILDMPSMIGDADARVLVGLCDEVVLLARWRKTARRDVQTAMRLVNASGTHFAGVALTRVGARRRGPWPALAPIFGRGGSDSPALARS